MSLAAFGMLSSAAWGDLIDENIRADAARLPSRAGRTTVTASELQMMEETSRDGINLAFKQVRKFSTNKCCVMSRYYDGPRKIRCGQLNPANLRAAPFAAVSEHDEYRCWHQLYSFVYQACKCTSKRSVVVKYFNATSWTGHITQGGLSAPTPAHPHLFVAAFHRRHGLARWLARQALQNLQRAPRLSVRNASGE